MVKQKFNGFVISSTQENQVLFQQYIEDFWKNLNKDVNSTQKIEENRNQDSKLNEEQIVDNKEALIEHCLYYIISQREMSTFRKKIILKQLKSIVKHLD